MDISLYGFTFSKFIKLFKDSYRIDSNMYDYMSFLKETDYGSYTVLILTYDNPNETLNLLLTPVLNNIQVVSDTKTQTGGVNFMAYAIFTLMFIQSISIAFAGPLQEKATAKLGIEGIEELRAFSKDAKTTMEMQQKSKPDLENYGSEGWFYGRYAPNEEQKQKFNIAFSAWQESIEYTSSRKQIADAAIGEYNREQQELSAAKIQKESEIAATGRYTAQTAFKQSEIQEYNTFLTHELYKENIKLTGEISFMKGVLATIATVVVGAGAVAYLIKRRQQQMTNYDYMHQYNINDYSRQQGLISDNLHERDVRVNPMQVGRRWGGKTKRHNKKHKRRHTKRH